MAEELELIGVSKRFGTVAAVEPLTLSVKAGTLLALLGPSGCGKTTTLRIVAGFEHPDTGFVQIGGRNVTGEPPNRRRLGMVFLNYSLFPHMTVAQNIAFGLKMARIPKPEIPARVNEALMLVRLPGFNDRYPAQLSGGQQQRVALARALVTSPAVLLLDEPLGALDKNLRESMQFELRQLQRRLGITTVLVTHDQEEALTMSDAVAVMNEGKILQTGSPDEVYNRPVSRFVSEFLGTSNIFEAKSLSGSMFLVWTEGAGPIKIQVASSKSRCSGEAVMLAIRPEKLKISDRPSGASNEIAAQVANRVFRGIYHAYQLTLPGREDPLVAYRQGEAGAFEIGSEVYVSWLPEDVVLLADERAEPTEATRMTV